MEERTYSSACDLRVQVKEVEGRRSGWWNKENYGGS